MTCLPFSEHLLRSTDGAWGTFDASCIAESSRRGVLLQAPAAVKPNARNAALRPSLVSTMVEYPRAKVLSHQVYRADSVPLTGDIWPCIVTSWPGTRFPRPS